MYTSVCVCLCVCVCGPLLYGWFLLCKASLPNSAICARPEHPSGKAVTVRQRLLQQWYGERAKLKILMMMIGRGTVSQCVCMCAADELHVAAQSTMSFPADFSKISCY